MELGETVHALPLGHVGAKLEETVADKPVPHVSAASATVSAPTNSGTRNNKVFTPRGASPGLGLALRLVPASTHLTLAPSCNASIAARIAGLGCQGGGSAATGATRPSDSTTLTPPDDPMTRIVVIFVFYITSVSNTFQAFEIDSNVTR